MLCPGGGGGGGVEAQGSSHTRCVHRGGGYWRLRAREVAARGGSLCCKLKQRTSLSLHESGCNPTRACSCRRGPAAAHRQQPAPRQRDLRIGSVGVGVDALGIDSQGGTLGADGAAGHLHRERALPNLDCGQAGGAAGAGSAPARRRATPPPPASSAHGIHGAFSPGPFKTMLRPGGASSTRSPSSEMYSSPSSASPS